MVSELVGCLNGRLVGRMFKEWVGWYNVDMVGVLVRCFISEWVVRRMFEWWVGW